MAYSMEGKVVYSKEGKVGLLGKGRRARSREGDVGSFKRREGELIQGKGREGECLSLAADVRAGCPVLPGYPSSRQPLGPSRPRSHASRQCSSPLAVSGLVLVILLGAGLHVSRGETGKLPVNVVHGGPLAGRPPTAVAVNLCSTGQAAAVALAR